MLRNYYKIDDSKIYQKHRPPSWDIRDCSYGYHIYPSDVIELREHPFNLKGGGLWFFSELKKIDNRIFFSAHFTDRIFFSIKFADRIFPPKKTIAPPLQVKWMFPYELTWSIEYIVLILLIKYKIVRKNLCENLCRFLSILPKMVMKCFQH